MIDITFLIARIVLGAYLLFNAYNHFKQVRMLSGYAASKGVPAARSVVILTGLMLGFGGLNIMTGYRPEAGVAYVVIFLVAAAFKMHNWWAISDLPTRGREFVNFSKNLALAAAVLMFLAIPTPWAYSLIP